MFESLIYREQSVDVRNFGEKVALVSLIAMFGVVAIHSNTEEAIHGAPQWFYFIDKLLTQAFTKFCVPFFFVVSGFFFARGAYVAGRETYWQLLKKKWQTLVMPYLCWGILGACIQTPVVVLNNFVYHKPILARTVFCDGTLLGSVNRILGITYNGPLGNLALWYLRALIIFFVLAPLWKTLIKWKWFSLVIAGVVLFVVPVSVVPYLRIGYHSVAWFMVGMAVWSFDLIKLKVDSKAFFVAAISYLVASLMVCLGYGCWYAVSAIGGIVFWWGVCDKVPHVKLTALGHQTFWVYCLHGPLMGYFIAGGLFVLGKTSVVGLVLSIVSPVFAIASCLFVYVLMHRYVPSLCRVLTGGRSL